MKLFTIIMLLFSLLVTRDNLKIIAYSSVSVKSPSKKTDKNNEVQFLKQALQDDFKQMRKTLEENHASLYEYTPKQVMDSLMEKQYELIRDSMRLHDFFKILTPVTAKIGCGHTAVWMPGSYWDIDPENLFPLQIKLIEGYVVVTGKYNDTLQVPVGSIILEINGRSVNDIITEMRTNYSADAFNIHFH